MGKSPEKVSSIQADIFASLEQDPLTSSVGEDLCIRHELRAACAKALKIARRHGKSRDRVVDEMNQLLPDIKSPITLRKINAWQAESKEDHSWPAEYIPAFCVACECDLPLRVMANTILMDLSDQRERLAQRLGQLEIESASHAREKRELKDLLRRQSR